MTDGLNLTGFNEVKPTGASPWPTENYTEAPASAFPSTDKSAQDGAGLGANGK
jgi:hypothetical protein